MNIIGVNPITSLLYIEIPKLAKGYGSHTANTSEVRADLSTLSSWYITHPDMYYSFDVDNGKAIVEEGTSRDSWDTRATHINTLSENKGHVLRGNPLIQTYNSNTVKYLRKVFSQDIKMVDDLNSLEECKTAIEEVLGLINDTFLIKEAIANERKEDVLEALGSVYSLYQAKRTILQLLKSKEE